MESVMLSNEEFLFLESFMLKSGEKLNYSKGIEQEDASFIDIEIIKQTERTLRVVGMITLFVQQGKEEPFVVDEELLNMKPTPKKKIHLNEHDPKTINWFKQGLIVKELRLKKDGKTPDAQYYRTGYRLYKFQQEQLLNKELQLKQEFNRWVEVSKALSYPSKKSFSELRKNGLINCLSFLEETSLKDPSQLKSESTFPNSWSVEKMMKFLHFFTAFLQLSMQKDDFDWKEIGAAYYKEIGGSKAFDKYKNEFIEQLEVIAHCPVAMLGMTSLGKITPLYFSGNMSGRYSSYEYGPVHSLTDLAISEEEYATKATTLWLVENRGILTRIAAEKNFLNDHHSLVLCVDGHLRSSHKSCIVQLLSNSNIKQVMIWSDYDPDGLNISKELYNTVSEFQQVIKWIAADYSVFFTWDEYEIYMEAFLKNRKMEQEEMLGGANDWKLWIQL